MPKFFVDNSQIKQDNIIVSGNDFNHIKTVLRKKIGDEITICTTAGTDLNCTIDKIETDHIMLSIKKTTEINSEPLIDVTLFQSLPKFDKMELIIQKCVELGINCIVPVQTSRTIVKINDSEKEHKKVQRWNKISEAAAKQCQRGIIPKIKNIMSFDESVIYSKKLDKSIIPYEKEQTRTMKQFINNFTGKSIGIFIGPEGGFSDTEINFAIKNNITPVTLGNRILRTETAGLYALSVIIYELG